MNELPERLLFFNGLQNVTKSFLISIYGSINNYVRADEAIISKYKLLEEVCILYDSHYIEGCAQEGLRLLGVEDIGIDSDLLLLEQLNNITASRENIEQYV